MLPQPRVVSFKVIFADYFPWYRKLFVFSIVLCVALLIAVAVAAAYRIILQRKIQGRLLAHLEKQKARGALRRSPNVNKKANGFLPAASLTSISIFASEKTNPVYKEAARLSTVLSVAKNVTTPNKYMSTTSLESAEDSSCEESNPANNSWKRLTAMMHKLRNSEMQNLAKPSFREIVKIAKQESSISYGAVGQISHALETVKEEA